VSLDCACAAIFGQPQLVRGLARAPVLHLTFL
jgi:hypothetical protein